MPRFRFFLSLLLISGASSSMAQTADRAGASVPVLSNRQSYVSDLLAVRRAEISLAGAELRLKRAEELLDRELISRQEFDEKALGYRGALVDYEDAVLRALSEHSHLVIERAVKRRDGSRMSSVELELVYVAPTIPAELSASEKLRNLVEAPLRNVFVSLEAGGIEVSDPYESRITEMYPDQPHAITVGLLRECDEVVVRLRYAGRVEYRPIVLLRDAADDVVAVSCPQFSQEADLGSMAQYTLTLERFSGQQEAVPLHVVGLPEEIGRTFVDPASEARVTEATFPGGEAVREVALRVFLPEQPSEAIVLDTSLTFEVVAGDPGADTESSTRLLLLPRGIPELELTAPNLFLSTEQGVATHSDVTIMNTGTVRLDAVQIEFDAPIGWDVTAEPFSVTRLEPGEKKSVRMTMQPRPDTASGEYEVKLRALTRSQSRRIESRSAVLRVRLEGHTPLLGSLLLGSVFLLLISGVVMLGVKVSRR